MRLAVRGDFDSRRSRAFQEVFEPPLLQSCGNSIGHRAAFCADAHRLGPARCASAGQTETRHVPHRQ